MLAARDAPPSRATVATRVVGPGSVVANTGFPNCSFQAAPDPLNATLCGLPAASSRSVSVPLRGPASDGVKLTVIVQPAPLASSAPQSFVCAKSPLSTRLAITSGASPLLVSPIDRLALVVWTSWLGKSSAAGLNDTAGAV